MITYRPPSGLAVNQHRQRRLRQLLAASLCAAVVGAQAVPTCTVATGATLNFGAIVALASTPDQLTQSGSSFWVNCSADVSNAPSLYSTTPWALHAADQTLPFQLSLNNFLTLLPTNGPGAALPIVANGSNQVVTIYARLLATQFRALPAGDYTGVVSVSIDY